MDMGEKMTAIRDRDLRADNAIRTDHDVVAELRAWRYPRGGINVGHREITARPSLR
jgi:hypothetical protein